MNTPTPTDHFSLDGRYRLLFSPVPQSPGCWNHLAVEVRRVADGALIGTTTRNLPNPHIYHFVSQDGVDYLVLSENYHGGYGVMDLATGKKAIYDPQTEEHPPGTQFWCWAAPVAHDPQARELVIAGCYWAFPHERTTYDFSRPMEPPYPILRVEDDELEEVCDRDSVDPSVSADRENPPSKG